jgi:hypothetical protein
MSISRRNNRALNRVLRDSLRTHARSEPQPQEDAAQNTPAYTLCADIPENYNDSYVRAIPKDPQNTFVYWEMPKDRAEGSLFADKGTAHVGNDEAVRIGRQLDENRQRRRDDNRPYADNGYEQERRQDDYRRTDNDCRRINWDNGSRHSFDGGDRQHNNNDRCQINWDDGNRYGFDGDNRQHHHNVDNYGQADNACRQIDWDNGGRYRLDEAYRHFYRNQDAIYRPDWNDGEQYRDDDKCRQPHNYQDGIYRLIWNEGGDYTPRGRDDGAAFSEMLSALIARCNQYIADHRLSGSRPPAYAMSSGLLCGAGKEPRT